MEQLSGEPAFVAIDVGGTNTRVSVGTMRESHQVHKFAASTKKDLLAGLSEVAEMLRARNQHVRGACVALAGPVLEGGRACSVTNYTGDDRRVTLDELPELLCPRTRTVLLNDLEATCYGLVALEHPNSPKRLAEFFATAWGPGTAGLHCEKKYCVLAVGTGLGSAAIMWNAAAKSFSVIPLEAGHAAVQSYGAAHAERGEEEKLFSFLGQKLGGNVHPPEYESFASGRGLADLYEFVSGEEKSALSPHEVAERGVAGSDEAAEKALWLHYKYLARCAQNLCVTLLLKDGIFWAGDNGVANGPWIAKHAAELHKEFLLHHKSEWIEHTPLFVQTQETNFNLLGAIFMAETSFNN